MRAVSTSPFAARLMQGPVTRGVCLGHGHLLVSGAVLSLDRPGALRMPNGVECELPALDPQAPVRVGAGRLEGDFGSVLVGPIWDPRPRPRFAVSTQPGLQSWPLSSLAGRGPGLTPLGDDIIAGYFAARALFGGDGSAVMTLAESLAARTTTLSGTLLRLAARGELPEAAHRLLQDGDPGPLLSWGASSGSGLLVGLGLAGAVAGSHAVQRLELILPLDPPREVNVEVSELAAS